MIPHLEDEAEPVEEVFAQARNAEVTVEELLVDDGWKLMEIEPETINGNGDHANGNGHDDLFGIGPTVELVPVNGIGHHDMAEEPQQSLFSWFEFMAEPGEAEGPQEQAPARKHLDVRVGDGAGAGADEGTGRRGTLGCQYKETPPT